MPSSLDELQKTLKLLHMEHAAEREKFAEVVTHVPLGQRVKTGVSWYPLILKRHY
jgi:hypothetical protein